MTDRFSTLTVVLERDIREDDAQALIAAIGQLRGVLSVAGDVSDASGYMAQERVLRDLADKLFAVIYPVRSTQAAKQGEQQ